MPTLIVTAISVILVAFALVAGSNFVNPAVQSRIEVARVLGAQYASISSAIGSYRMENHGVAPSSLDDVRGYIAQGAIDGFGQKTKMFEWSIEKGASGRSVLCLSFVRGGNDDFGIVLGLQRFALDMEDQRPGRTTIGQDCGSQALAVTAAHLPRHMTETASTVSIRFEER